MIGGGLILSGIAGLSYYFPKMASNIPAEANVACVWSVGSTAVLAVGSMICYTRSASERFRSELEQRSERFRSELERTLESIEDSGRRAREEIRSYSR